MTHVIGLGDLLWLTQMPYISILLLHSRSGVAVVHASGAPPTDKENQPLVAQRTPSPSDSAAPSATAAVDPPIETEPMSKKRARQLLNGYQMVIRQVIWKTVGSAPNMATDQGRSRGSIGT